MTYVEKLKQDHPDYTDDVINYILSEECPSDKFFTATDPDYCDPYTQECLRCWEREVPEETVTTKSMADVVEDLPTPAEPTILDSGDRTQFESGAVRDMRAGKGRFDVMPLEVIRDYLEDDVIGYIANFMQDNDTSELYNALEAFCGFKDEYTLLLETAIHFEQGAVKYGPDNWRHGIPTWCYIDSAVRHYIKWLRGDKEERHDRAFCWNIMCCIWEVNHGEEWRAAQKIKETK